MILPDGCMDLIVVGERVCVAGADTIARRSQLPAGTRCVGARFAPGRLPVILEMPADLLVDQVVQFDELALRTSFRGLGAVLVDQVLLAEDSLGQLDETLAASLPAVDGPASEHAAELLGSGWPVADVAAELGYSSRQLQRRSQEWFGYGPKHLGAVCRFQRALALWQPGRTLSHVAAAAGYADQAHLARDARRLGGATFATLARGSGSPADAGEMAEG